MKPSRSVTSQRIVLHTLSLLLLLLVLTSEYVINVPLVLAAPAKTQPPQAQGKNTIDAFHKVGNSDTKHYYGPLKRSSNFSSLTPPKADLAKQARPQTPLSSTGKATMPTLRQTVSADMLATGAQTSANRADTSSVHPQFLQAANQQVTVEINPNSLDLSQASVKAGATAQAVTGNVTFQISQRSGHYKASANVLGTYDVSVLDAQGHAVQGLHVRQPLRYTFHYQPGELASLGLDPDHMYVSWPDQIVDAQQKKQSTRPFAVPLVNDPVAHTLSAATTVAPQGTMVVAGTATQQTQPTPALGSVSGNSGNFSVSYPIQVPPGPAGFKPQLSFDYSSGDPNGRHSQMAPADSLGDGWSLGLPSITSSTEPSGSGGPGTWYNINIPGHISDRLVPDPTNIGFFYTEHISHWRIVGTNITSTNPTPTCFHAWDPSGTYYSFGCTTDSLEYSTDSTGTRTNYKWAVDTIVAPTAGPNLPQKQVTYSYFQESQTPGGYVTISDSAIAQMVYKIVDGSTTKVIGTLDFHYQAPTFSLSNPAGTSKSWVTQYTASDCQGTPPSGTTNTFNQRCDNPLDDGAVKAPTVLGLFSLQSFTSYIGADTENKPAYSYSLSYTNTPFSQINDPLTWALEYVAGEHLLTSITPTAYISGSANTLKPYTFNYIQQTNHYSDLDHTTTNGSGRKYITGTNWSYLTHYVDTETHIGGDVTYALAYGNSHGTPYVTDSSGNITDDRHDPLYCVKHANDADTSKQCQSPYDNNEDHNWTNMVVTSISTLDSGQGVNTTNYAYALNAYGTYSQNYQSTGRFCVPAGTAPYKPGQDDCVYDTYIPPTPSGGADSDWQDYYNGEFRGFGKVYITHPDGNLSVNSYYAAEAWGTPQTNSQNYQSGSLYQEDVYWGNVEDDNQLIQRTVTQYSGNSQFLPQGSQNLKDGCLTGFTTSYIPCETVVVFSKTTQYEGAGISGTDAPWKQVNYTYDDYDSVNGVTTGHGYYHNVTQAVTTGSNIKQVTQKTSYAINDGVTNGITYYLTDKISHSEIDDDTSHVWSCQDTTYDEGSSAGVSPSVGLPTTVQTYTNCGNHSSGQTYTLHTMYDKYGNAVASVDAFGSANSGLYSNTGCSLSTAPVYQASSWTASHYTTCSVFDSYYAQATDLYNVYNQHTQVTFDYTSGGRPTSSTDINGQTTSVGLLYDSNGNEIERTAEPGETGSYTSQTVTLSNCTDSSTTPCYEVDSSSALYSNAVTRVFYDSTGRAVETRSPLDASNDLITFTVYNDVADTTFTSVPFRVPHGTGWIDPNTATIDGGSVKPAGTTTLIDPLGRVMATQDPALGSAAEPGISCSGQSGLWTSCVYSAYGQAYGDSQNYGYTETVNGNQQMSVAFVDVLGRTRYVQSYSAAGNSGANITSKTETQYNALGLPTAVIVTDFTPQSGEDTTTVTTTAQYDDLGHQTQLTDPDRGVIATSYDAGGRAITVTSGTHTIGSSYDLLGRVLCVQDAAPTTDGSGACSGGSHPLEQYVYGTSKLGTPGSTDFPTGRLTQDISTTYYPDGSSSQSTLQYQHDARGQLTAETMQVSVPSSWNVTTALPTYEETQAYNNDGQATTTQTTVNGQSGFTFSQAYDSTTGTLVGVSNNATGAPNLASLSFEGHGLTSAITYQSTTGTALATEQYGYDGNLRATGATATWQSGSGSSGTIYSEQRGYDPIGNVSSKSSTYAAVPGKTGSGGSETQNFCYNELNQLIWAGNSGTQPTPPTGGSCGTQSAQSGLQGATYSDGFAYTHLGQLWQAPLNGSGSSLQYLYCDSSHPHQLSGIYPAGTTCATKNDGSASYLASYDAWGNQTGRTYKGTTATLSYDVQNELVQWNAGSTSQEWYAYDNGGSRTLRRSTTSAGTTLTIYAFGLEEHTYSSTGTTTGDTYYYTLGGHLLGKTDGSTTQFYLTDSLGSVVETFTNTANSAAVLGNQTYGPYGNQRYTQGAMGTDKGFTGQYTDTSGLDYYNARYYDPVVGQFTAPDTVEGNMQGADPYTYVGGNPETNTDPTGNRIDWGGGEQSIVNWNTHTAVTTESQTSTWSQVIDSWGGGNYRTTCVYGCAGTRPWYNSPSSAYITHYVNTHTTVRHAAPVVHKAPAKPKPKPKPASNPVLDGLTTVGKGLLWAGDQFLGVSSMVNDVHTLTGNGSWQEKALAAGDLGMNAFMDISMVFGVGEELRGGELMAKGGFELAEEGGEHLAEACGLSFSYTTTVAIEGGSQSIGSLKVGQKVWAYNTQTKKMELEPIQHVIVTKDNDLVDLTISTQAPAKHLNSETIHTNKKHPFLVAGKGFIPVGKLRLGMQIVEANGQLGVVTGWKSVTGSEVMYNLTVTQDHTYTVGDGHWIVHNEGPCTGTARQAISSIKMGSKEVTVASRAEAEQVCYELCFKNGYKSTTGWSKFDIQQELGTTEGTYHWDDQFDSDGNLAGHGEDNPHGWAPHLQIHPEGWGGRSIHVFFNP